MRKRFILTAACMLLLCLMLGTAVYAAGGTTNILKGYPGDTWTVENPTTYNITLPSLTGYSYVITDASGLVKSRSINPSGSSVSIPAGGKAILMNWEQAQALVLDSRFLIEKDQSPALIRTDLDLLDWCEFENITDHPADVLLTTRIFSYILYDADGSVLKMECVPGSSSSGIEDTISVPAGGRINILCGTQGWFNTDQSGETVGNLHGSVLARSENFRWNWNAEAPFTVFRLFHGMSRSFTNVTEKACTVYGSGMYVLYNEADRVSEVKKFNNWTASVPAGYTIAVSEAGGFAVPNGYFEEADLPGLEYYTFPSSVSMRFENISGTDATIWAENTNDSSYTTIYTAGGMVRSSGTNSSGTRNIEVPAQHTAVLTPATASQRVCTVGGQFKVTESEHPSVIRFSSNTASDIFLVTNLTGEEQQLYVGSKRVQVKEMATDNVIANTSAVFVTIPANTAVLVNANQQNAVTGAYAPYGAFSVHRYNGFNNKDEYMYDTHNTYMVTNLTTRKQWMYTGVGNVELNGSSTIYLHNANPETLSYLYGPGEMTVRISPVATATSDWHHLVLAEGESCLLKNTSGEAAVLSFNGYLDYCILNENGTQTSSSFIGQNPTSTSLTIPAGSSFHATCVKGLSTVDAYAKLFDSAKDPDPASVRVTIKAGETYLCSNVYKNFGALKRVDKGSNEEGTYETYWSTPDCAQLIGWANCKAEKAEGSLNDSITLNAGESCRLTLKNSMAAAISANQPYLAVKHNKDGENVSAAVGQDHFTYLFYEAESVVLSAVFDNTIIHYAPLVFDAEKTEENPLLPVVIEKGTSRDLARDLSIGSCSSVSLFGLNPQAASYNSWNGLLTEDWTPVQYGLDLQNGMPVNIKAEDSDIVALGVKGYVEEDPVTLRAYDAVLYDKNGNETYSPAENGVSSIVLNCEATAVTPAALNVFLTYYDNNDRFVGCESRQIKRSDLGPACRIPCSCDTNVTRVDLMVLDDAFRPNNPLIIPVQ